MANPHASPQAQAQEQAQDQEATITALQAEVAALRAEMQSLTYTVSHDLRAPLRHIVSYAQLVQEDAGPLLGAEVQGFLATIMDSAQKMGEMLDALLALSRLGAVHLQLAPVPLQGLVQGVVQELSAAHPQRTIDWQIASDLPTVLADGGLLRQAVLQVIGNAVKFTARRTAAVVEIGCQARHDAACVVHIRDNGAGFDPAHVSKLFQVFQRLHSQREFEGLGMGLALSRKICERHACSIEADGVVDGGCTVRMTLRMAKSA